MVPRRSVPSRGFFFPRKTRPKNNSLLYFFCISLRLHMAAGRLSFRPEVAISRSPIPKIRTALPKIQTHVTSPHLTSAHVTSPHLTSAHLSSPHLTSRHLTSPHVIATATHPSMKESTQGGGAKRRPPVWIPSREGVWLWL